MEPSHTTSELIWISYLLHQLEIESFGSMYLWCDSWIAIHIITNLVFHKGINHIEVDCYFMRHIKIGDQLAYLFTKALLVNQVDEVCNKLSMFNINVPA